MKKISIQRIFIFYTIAIVISNLFRFDIFDLNEKFSDLTPWLSVVIRTILEGSGVFVGALVGIALLRKERKPVITFQGLLKNKNLLMLSIGILVLTIIGVTNDYHINKHIYGFLAAVITFLYCVMEEYGWRGYLQEELSSLKPLLKYILIGVLWYIWHLTFLKEVSLQDNLFFLGMMIFGSWGIGKIADSTKSIIASACFHLIVQIMMFNALFRNGLTGTQKGIALAVCVVLWVLILRKWEKENTTEIKEHHS